MSLFRVGQRPHGDPQVMPRLGSFVGSFFGSKRLGFLDGDPVRNPCQNRPLLALRVNASIWLYWVLGVFLFGWGLRLYGSTTQIWLFVPHPVGLLWILARQVFGPWLKARGLELSPRPVRPRTKFFGRQRPRTKFFRCPEGKRKRYPNGSAC